MKQYFINQFKIDEEFTDFFLVKSIAIRIGSNRKQYLDITLADNSGEINGKKWDVNDEEAINLGKIKEGDLVKIRASVSEWNNVKQLRIARIRKGQKEDGCAMVDFIKAAPEDPEAMYAYIHGRAETIADEGLRAMALLFLDREKERLLYYPAAMRNHHAEMAGLLYHIKRMLVMGEKACEVYTQLDRDWIVCGVILHDMEKLNEIQSNELGISGGYTFEGQMLGHLVLGAAKVAEMAKETGLSEEKTVLLQHMMVSHHYEPDFGSPKKPMFPEAEILHEIDLMDARMYEMNSALLGVEPGTFTERVWALDRRLYKRLESPQ